MSVLDRWLDRSIVASFDRTGFARHARSWPDAEERDLDGASVLITGGTAGIGLAAAGALAGRGARPHLWGRDVARGRLAADQVGGAFSSVDLGDLVAVGDAARALALPALAAVVLNAGAMPLQRVLTDQGHELVWASQVLGHVLLLRVLRSRGWIQEGTRVIWVSSGGMYTARLDLRDLRRDEAYQRHSVYANAKRAQVVLADELTAKWPEVHQASMHPGWVDTAAVRHSMPVFHRLVGPILRTPEQGADTIVWLASVAERPPSGRFWFDRRAEPTHTSSRTRERDGDREALVARVFAATDAYVEA